MKELLSQLFLFSIPEAIAVSWVILGLLGSKRIIKQGVIIGIVVGTVVLIPRITIGSYVHNVMIFLATYIAMISLLKISYFWERVVSVIIAISVYLMIEFINIFIFRLFIGDELFRIFEDTYVKFMCFLPQLGVTILLAFIIYRYSLVLFFKTKGSDFN